jgi:CHAD domain-containing protein
MPNALTANLLTAPAAEAVRVVATELLKDVNAGFDAFIAEKPEGLHDLRVALRRLRSWLRAHREFVRDTLRKKTRRQLRDLADATNDARDTEVALEWIAAQLPQLSAREKSGARFIITVLERERLTAFESTREVLVIKLPTLIDTLKKDLGFYWVRRNVQNPAPEIAMASAMNDALISHGKSLVRALGRVRSADEVRDLHRARIAAKRLRYLLQEAIPGDGRDGLIARLTSLQDTLGHCHDMQGITNRLVREMGQRAARETRLRILQEMRLSADQPVEPLLTRVRPGLAALARQAHQNQRNAYHQVRSEWKRRAALALVDAILTRRPLSP